MSCIPYFTCEPMVKTVQHDSADICHYDIVEITGMQDDTELQGSVVYSGQCYAPDAYGDVDFGGQLRSMIDTQIRNIKTLQYRNSQGMGLTQSTFAFNSYYSVDDGGSDDTFYSVLYDTRGITAYEAGARTYLYGPGDPYPANNFPDPNIMHGQYVSIMYRNPSNLREMETYSLGLTYCYLTAQSAGRQASREEIDDARATIDAASRNTSRQVAPPDPSTYGLITVANHVIDSSITGQSFRYSGTADWQDWGQGHGGLLWARFWVVNSKGTKTYLTPYLYPKWCEDPGTMYLYYVNSMGGIDFIRSTYASSTELNTERDMYETDYGINDRFEFGEETYHQRRWNKYTFKTSLIKDEESYGMADVINTRWAWLYIPDDTVLWRSVKVTGSSAKVKQVRNEGHKLYNYEFQLEDSIKAKIV